MIFCFCFFAADMNFHFFVQAVTIFTALHVISLFNFMLFDLLDF